MDLDTPYLYLILNGLTLFPTLALSFDKKVAYFTRWKFLLPAIGIMGFIFTIYFKISLNLLERKVSSFIEKYAEVICGFFNLSQSCFSRFTKKRCFNKNLVFFK